MGQMQKFDFNSPAMDETTEERAEANRATASLAGLAIALFLVVAGLVVIRQLQADARLQDCLLSGQRSCASIGKT